MDLSELVAGLDVTFAANRGGPCRVCDITEDSRTAVPGSLFIARTGLKADGKRYIEDAAAAGAVAILTDDPHLAPPEGFRLPILFAADVPLISALIAERFYGHPTRSLKLSGVTGTNGKSTITYLIHQVMNHAGVRCGLIGTVLIDDGTEVARASMTTPPALELSRTFAVMKESGCAAASIEVSSHALDQRRADALAFDVAVFTNLTGDHLDYHKTMENYAAAKARLFELLPASGTAIVNADDPWTSRMIRDCKARVWKCALNAAPNEADPAGPDECRATVIEESMHGMLLAMEGPWGVIEAQVPLIGRYNAMNVLQAAAACFAKGLTREQLCAALPELQAPPGRLQKVSRDEADDITVFVDFAHSDDSLRNCLASVAKVIPGRQHGGSLLRNAAGTHRASPLPSRSGGPATGRLWVVFGCGGNKDATKRPRMGAAAIAHADIVVVTSDNPRLERPSDIIDQILAGIPQDQRDRVAVQADRGRAIRHAIERAAAGDVVVLAGKGHENEQIVAGPDSQLVRVHFDDAMAAHAALQSRSARIANPHAGLD
jgi:UDP-N-acetylmuramoyl-L-alanyl-D-glutamate--2,6-diaminopimelate ligase